MSDSPMIQYTGTPASGASAANNLKPMFAKRAKSHMMKAAKLKAARECAKQSMSGRK